MLELKPVSKIEVSFSGMCNDKLIFWLEPFIKSFKRYNDGLKLF
jgi:hypothetical protein